MLGYTIGVNENDIIMFTQLILKENDGTCSITDVQADAGRGDAKSEGRSCSVHLRRGDYLEEDNMKIFGNICTDAYYDAALELAVKNGTGRFFIFSEDPHICPEKSRAGS